MKSARGLAVFVFGLCLAHAASAQEVVVNGGFESGTTGWTTWDAPANGFWQGPWLRDGTCDIWPPGSGCTYSGSGSYFHEKGSNLSNAHGGVFQVVPVLPNRLYRISGQWSGGVTGNAAGNATWWEFVAYDGSVDATVIDAAPRPQDHLVDKIEAGNLAQNGVQQFQWTPFERVIQTGPATTQITLALKHGSFYTLDSAAYLDDVRMSLLPAHQPVPALDARWLGLLGLLTLGLAWRQVRRA